MDYLINNYFFLKNGKCCFSEGKVVNLDRSKAFIS